MCLIVFSWRPGDAMPLVVAANRDEFYARPSQSLAAWSEKPSLHAGRDLEGGGTWMGIGAEGRFAAVTNIRDPSQVLGDRSRGELPVGFLSSAVAPEEYMSQVAASRQRYSGFNLLIADRRELWHLNSRTGSPRPLPAGVYGLSNATLDTPWPKTLRARDQLEAQLSEPTVEGLLALLADTHRPADEDLPRTGVPLETERLLGSAFIASETYGTRASTVLLVHADGHREFAEQCFGPQGQPLGITRLTLLP